MADVLHREYLGQVLDLDQAFVLVIAVDQFLPKLPYFHLRSEGLAELILGVLEQHGNVHFLSLAGCERILGQSFEAAERYCRRR